MSSSRIFKDDPAFTPVSLVNETRPAAPAPPAEQPPVQEPQTAPPQQAPVTEEPPVPAPDLDAIRAEAYEQGKNEARQAVKKELGQTIEAFSRACGEIDKLHESLIEQSRGDMINLVIALSKKIIGRELTTGRNVIVDTLKNAIELAIKHNEYDIWINPEDLEAVEAMVPELISSVQKLEHVTLKTDPDITPGGCRLDSSLCTVDATIEAQLETARDFLEEKGPECRKTDSGSDAEPENVPPTG